MILKRLFEKMEENFDNPEYVAEFIKKNCQPFLKENNSLMPFYRGVMVDEDDFEEALIKDVRNNRNPMNTNTKIHEIFSNAFKEAGFTATRNNSLFVTPQISSAKEYGNLVYVVFPIGNFSYTYSNVISDMFFQITSIIEKLGITYISPELISKFDITSDTELKTIMWYLESESRNVYDDKSEIFLHPELVKVNWDNLPNVLKDLYTNKNIDVSMHEVMIHCDQVLMIWSDFYEDKIEGLLI